MTRTTTIRNIAIVLVLAALVDLVPGGGSAWNVILQVISLIFLGLIVWIASRLYREHRITIYSLGSRRRAILYAAVGLVTITLTATDRLWSSPGGSIAWLFLIAVAAYALYAVYRSSREY